MAPAVVMYPPAEAPGTAGGRPGTLRPLRLIHPYPTLLNVAASAGLAFIAADGQPPAGTLARMLLMMFCAQAAIGAVNDIADRELDASAKPWKPIPSGAVPLAAAVALAAVLLAATIALAATLGALPFALALAGTACGLAYDIRLKRTAFSALPLMAAIPLLPLWVYASLDAWRGELLWVVPLGAAVGLALYLANTVPDIETDRAHGVRGFAHRLGAPRAALLALASLAFALAMSLAIAPFVAYDGRVYVPVLAGGGALLAASAALLARDRARGTSSGFGLLAAGAALLAGGWLASLA